MLSAVKGYDLTLISDAALSKRLCDLVATIKIIQTPDPVGGFQKMRMDRPNRFIEQMYRF